MKRNWRLWVAGVMVMVAWANGAMAHMVEVPAESSAQSHLRQIIEKKFPGLQIRQIATTEVPDWYLVETNTDSPDGIMYMHRDGRYVLAGNVFDIEMGRNVTMEIVNARQQHVLEDWDLAKTVQLTPRDEKVAQPIILFDDPDCPVCRRMHGEVKKLVDAGVKVSVVLFPLMSIHPDAYRKSVGVWCAENRVAALDKVLAGQSIESGAESAATPCAHPIDENLRLAKRLGVSKTPTVFLPNGQRVEGFHSAEEFLAMLHLPGPVAAATPNR